MRAFKRNLFSITALAGTLMLSACDLPSPKQDPQRDALTEGTESSSATFNTEFMPSRSAVLESRTVGEFSLPKSKVFNLYVCVKDKAYNKPVKGHVFLIEETGQKSTTDSTGCLTWKETIEYNFLADSKYIRQDRHIRATGLHRGTRSVSFAINPWSHGENLSPVVEIKENSSIPQLVESSADASKALKGLAADNTVKPRSLWVEDGRLFVTEEKLTAKGANIAVELRAIPTILLTKTNGELYNRSLTAGTFKARLKLIHTYHHDGQELRRLLGESPELEVKMGNGSLAIRSSIFLPLIPTRGQIQLGLHLDPVNAPEGLKSFDGVYLLGEYDQIKGISFARLSTIVAQTKDFRIENYINSVPASMVDMAHNDKNDADVYQKPKIEIAELEFPTYRVLSDTTSEREVLFNVKACIRNGLDQKTTRAHTFRVTKFRQSEKESAVSYDWKTDNNACIRWSERIQFKFFDCHRYLKGFVVIENQDLGMSEKLEILINPWEPYANVARDARYVDHDEKLPLTCENDNRPKTKLFIDSFSYNTLSYDYDVDDLLNLTVKKKIQIRTEPRMLTYSSLANGRSEPVQRLRDGIYLLKVALIQNKDYDVRTTYVASDVQLVHVLSGLVNVPVTFAFQDLKAIGNRNNLLIELFPVKEDKIQLVKGQLPSVSEVDADNLIDFDSHIESQTYIAPISLSIDEATRPARLLDGTAMNNYLVKGISGPTPLKSFISQVAREGKNVKVQTQARIKARHSLEQFAKDNNLDLIRIQNLDSQDPMAKLYGPSRVEKRLTLSKKDLEEMIVKGQLSTTTAQKLCPFWTNNYLPKQSGDVPFFLDDTTSFDFSHKCYIASGKDIRHFFQIEKRLDVQKLGSSTFLRGYNQALNVGTSFSLNTSYATYHSTTKSWSAKIGLSLKLMDLFTMGSDVYYNMSWAKSHGNNTSNTINVNTSTTMTALRNVFKLRFDEYERCAIVRMNPRLFVDDGKNKNFVSNIHPRLPEERAATAATRGLLLCEGHIQKQPLEVTENYYLVSQDITMSQIQDIGDARNRNFFVALRSANDFNRFMIATKSEYKMPEGSEKEVKAHEEAIDGMIRIFDLPSSSHPGMYLVQ